MNAETSFNHADCFAVTPRNGDSHLLFSSSIASMSERENGRTPREWVIRVLDVAIAVTLLICFLPLMLLLSGLVYLSDPGPVIFAHKRIGRGGQLFRVYKFRSMVQDAQARLEHLLKTDPEARECWEREHKLRVDPRITPFGRFLRKSSLDELPQLFNVLKGEMSLIGPRPICIEEARRYGRYLTEYCSVRPGISGLWQVSGRNDVSYRRRVALDVIFVRKNTVEMYFWVLLRTLPAALSARGSY